MIASRANDASFQSRERDFLITHVDELVTAIYLTRLAEILLIRHGLQTMTRHIQQTAAAITRTLHEIFVLNKNVSTVHGRSSSGLKEIQNIVPRVCRSSLSPWFVSLRDRANAITLLRTKKKEEISTEPYHGC